MSEQREHVIPKASFTTEFYVGLFALAGILCFAYLAIGLAGMRILNRGKYPLEAEFDNIAGVKLGAPIELAGVQIGEVNGITLTGTSARAALLIDSEVQLREDDNIAVRTKGIIGDRYLKIIPGSSEKLLGPGQELVHTESAVELEEILGKMIHRME